MTAIVETEKPARVLTFDKATANPLTHWNRKYGLDIWAFALPTSTCDYSTKICRKACYSKNIWKNIRPRYLINLKGTFKHRFVRLVTDQIKAEDIETIRIHVTGDFYSQDYFDKWVEIARNCPQVKILAYTRNYDLDASNAPENLILYYSVDATTVKENPTIKLRAILFRAERGKKLYQHMEKFNGRERTFVCSSRCEHCKACWSGKIDVAFPIRAGRYQYKVEHEPHLLDRHDWRTRLDNRGNPVLAHLVPIDKVIPIAPNDVGVPLRVPRGKAIDDVKQCCETPALIDVGNERFCSNCGLVEGAIRVKFNGKPAVDNLLKKVMSNEKQKMEREIGKDRPKITRQSFKKQMTKILSIVGNMKREFAELESLIANVQEKKPRKKKATAKAIPPNVHRASGNDTGQACHYSSNENVSPIQKVDGKGLLTNHDKIAKVVPKAMQYNGDTKCLFCERLFFSTKGQIMHMLWEHAAEYRSIRSANPPKQAEDLKKTIRKGWENCPQCGIPFRKNRLYMHVLRHHEKRGGRCKKILEPVDRS